MQGNSPGASLKNSVPHEARFQIDLQVPGDAVKAALPDGFALNVAAQGPAKDCNLRLIFIDRVTVNGPTAAARQGLEPRRMAGGAQ